MTETETKTKTKTDRQTEGGGGGRGRGVLYYTAMEPDSSILFRRLKLNFFTVKLGGEMLPVY